MAGTLYIQLQSQHQPNALALDGSFAFALIQENDRILSSGIRTSSELFELSRGCRRMVLILSACDANIVTCEAPQISAAKLRAALPNLVEEAVLIDPENLILQELDRNGNSLNVLAVEKKWIEQVVEYFKNWKHVQIHLVAEQCLYPSGESTQVFVRSSENTWIVTTQQNGQCSAFNLFAEDPQTALQTILALLPKENIKLFLPEAQKKDLQENIDSLFSQGKDDSFQIEDLTWHTRVSEARVAPNLLRLVKGGLGQESAIKQFKFPILIAIAIMAIHLIGLNIEWLSMKREATQLDDASYGSFKAAFPKESVIRDPKLQAQQKLNQARKAAGQFVGNDFVVLANHLSEALERILPGRVGIVQQIDYREQSIIVKFKTGEAPNIENLKSVLSEKSLKVTQNNDGLIQITSMGGK